MGTNYIKVMGVFVLLSGCASNQQSEVDVNYA